MRTGGRDGRERAYAEQGFGAAMGIFASAMGMEGGEPPDLAGARPEAQETMARMGANMDFFLAHVAAPFSRYTPAVDALRAGPARVVVAVAADSVREPPHVAGAALAERLGIVPVMFPGGHGGFTEHPAAWGRALREALAD